MDFKAIIGNDSLKALIASHIKSRTLSHGYIIEGPKGSGKRTLAREICKALCCIDSDPSIPCGACRSCKRIDDGYNTDIFVLNKGDKASISVEDVRNMTSTLGYYPDDGDKKIYIIEEADKMTVQAQNALLLSLEDPPAYVVFLLLCEDSSALLETVRSRAQVLKTEIFSREYIIEYLKSHPFCKKATDEQLAKAAAVSRGALGEALNAISEKKQKSSSVSADAEHLIELFCTGTKAEAVVFASTLKYSRAEFELFFEYALFAVRDLLCAKCNGDTTTYYADIQTASDLARRLNVSKLTKIYDALTAAKDDITKNNAHIYAVMTTLAASAV